MKGRSVIFHDCDKDISDVLRCVIVILGLETGHSSSDRKVASLRYLHCENVLLFKLKNSYLATIKLHHFDNCWVEFSAELFAHCALECAWILFLPTKKSQIRKLWWMSESLWKLRKWVLRRNDVLRTVGGWSLMRRSEVSFEGPAQLLLPTSYHLVA